MTEEEAVDLLRAQPIGTMLISSPSVEAFQAGHVHAVFVYTQWDKWVQKETSALWEYKTREVAAILYRPPSQGYFIWSLS